MISLLWFAIYSETYCFGLVFFSPLLWFAIYSETYCFGAVFFSPLFFFLSANNLTAAHAKTAEDNATKIFTLHITVKQNIPKKN